MSDGPANYRMERISRLLDELKYEITRGIMEREIDDHVGYRFVVPVSQTYAGGAVRCEFRTVAVPDGRMLSLTDHDAAPRLRLVK